MVSEFNKTCPGGETGTRISLRWIRPQGLGGSSPLPGTTYHSRTVRLENGTCPVPDPPLGGEWFRAYWFAQVRGVAIPESESDDWYRVIIKLVLFGTGFCHL